MLESPSAVPPLKELVRVPSPAALPQSLAFDGELLWIGSWETSRIYAISPKHGNVLEETAAPGKPVGSTVVGDELRFIVSENGDDDNRFIRRFIPGHGFKSHDAKPCPDDTGSFLAYDGRRLWLSQRYKKRVIELDAQLAPLRTIEVGEQILGFTFARDLMYFSTWLGKERGGCRIASLDPSVAAPSLRFVAAAPFVAVSLARDGDRLWTNDSKGGAVVAFELPQ